MNVFSVWLAVAIVLQLIFLALVALLATINLLDLANSAGKAVLHVILHLFVLLVLKDIN